jgi:hypothetical protein
MFKFYPQFLVRKVMLALTWILLALPAISQLSVGADGMFVANSTPLGVDSLVIVPSADLTLTSTSIERSSIPIGSTVSPGMTSIERVYTIGTPFTFTGLLGIMYLDSELGANTESQLELAYRETPPGQWITTTGSSVNTVGNYVENVVTSINLSGLTATTLGVVLPITFYSISARLDGQHVLIDWEAEANTSLSGFYVESSTDSRTWTTAGYVSAVQHSRRYNFKDGDINFTTRYYRIGMIEANGAITYTRIAQVRKPGSPFSLQISSTGGGKVINFINGTPDGIELFDLNGRLLKQANVAQASYDLGMLSPGIYILRFRVGSEFQVRKLFLE